MNKKLHAIILTGLICTAGAGSLAQAEEPSGKAPLVIAQQGNFYVGGREVALEGGTIVADEMYVEYQIPAEQTHPYPLVFLHGGMSSGAYWWSRPDGGEGWATLFLRKGYAVYVVDRPTHGRSPHYEDIDGKAHLPPLSMPRPGPGSDPEPDDPDNRFPGSKVPGDPAYEQSLRGRQASVELPFGLPDPVAVSARMDGYDREAGAALLDRIGPAVLVTHSRSGASGWQIADARPELVKAIVAAEPNGPPFYNAPPLGQPGDPVSRPFGITYAPLTYDPAVETVADFGGLVQRDPEGEGLVGCWVPRGEQPQLVNLSDIPVMVMTGESSYHAGYDHCTAQYFSAAGVPADYVNLGDMGITGNTHSFMRETNNAELADIAAEWLTEKGL